MFMGAIPVYGTGARIRHAHVLDLVGEAGGNILNRNYATLVSCVLFIVCVVSVRQVSHQESLVFFQ